MTALLDKLQCFGGREYKGLCREMCTLSSPRDLAVLNTVHKGLFVYSTCKVIERDHLFISSAICSLPRYRWFISLRKSNLHTSYKEACDAI